MRPLGDLCDFLSGFAFKSGDLKGDSGIPVVKIKNVNNKVVTLEDIQFFPEEKLDEKIERFLLNDGDVLIAMTGQGSVGRVGRLRIPENTRLLLNQRVGKFIAKEGIANLDYIYYVVSSDKYESILFNAASGSGQPNLSPATIKSILVPYTPYKEQVKIAQVLTVLDNKITLNRQINQTLEQMAQALFKSWFVDFDPVVDNALDAGFFEQNSDLPEELLRRAEQRKIVREQPDFKPLPAETRQLFPAAFEECEEPSLGLGGWVPKGWKILQLKDLSEKISKGTTPRSRDIEVAKDDLASVLFVKVKDMTDDNRVRLDNLESIPKSVSSGVLKRSVLCEGDILLSIAGTIGRIASVEKELDGSNCNQAVAFLRPKDKKAHHLFIKQTLQSERVRQYIDSKVVQAVQANFSLTHFGEIQTVLPSDQVIQKFNLSATTYSSRTISNLRQIDVLTRLRDTLLPKLISGELRLNDDGTLASGNTDC